MISTAGGYDNQMCDAARSVHVVIVNWNSGDKLRECLSSFSDVATDKISLLVITVVDNASSDGSIDGIADLVRTVPVRVIRNSHNVGFAAACNQGAAGSIADFLLFLNPDTRLRGGCLEAPVEFLNGDKAQSVGIVGAQLVSPDGKVARTCARRPSVRSMIGQCLGLDRIAPSVFSPHFQLNWAHDDVRSVDQVMGAFFFIRRNLFDELKGFDERFFVYYEDLDLSMRAYDHGWTSVYLSTAKVVHGGHGCTNAIRARRLFYFCRSRILFSLKYFPAAGSIAVLLVTVSLEPIARSFAALAKLRIYELSEVACAFVLLWMNLANIVATHMRSAND